MVVLLDLDDKDALDPRTSSVSTRGFPAPIWKVTQPATAVTSDRVNNAQRPNANLNSFAAALSCYPIVSQIALSLDLNSLHALSRTCRQFRQTLLHYRDSLVQRTLRCEFDQPIDVSGQRVLSSEGQAIQTGGLLRYIGYPTAYSKIGPCARDMVGDCRRCGTIICRNCAHKPPSPWKLPNRHRRLCSTCLSAPLSQLTLQAKRLEETAKLHDFVPREPCTCDSQGVYLCMHCGYGLAQDDTTYRRIWTWRTRYSTYLGGLGTGVGEGNEGVKCARKEQCLGAQIVDVEGECPTAESSSPLRRSETPDDGEVVAAHHEELADVEAGYLRQEIEGIGGVVKKKYKRRVRVGAPVREWEDEREGGQLLGREISGAERSWCAWCKRVVLGRQADEVEMRHV
ncbi:MAG: hypothetical protein Q9191_003488 [Dirinaria sp. TL-2023a]